MNCTIFICDPHEILCIHLTKPALRDYNNTVIDNGIIKERIFYMAVKDHSLDDKIIEAAFGEFMEHGFLAASLHKIADIAGVTTGALYTRYKNKDALFCSLLEGIFTVFRDSAEPAAEQYRKAEESGNIDDFLAAMEYEAQIYMDILFDHYEECVLFFCKSGGSSAEESLNAMIKHKADTTVEFFEKTAVQPVNREAVRLLMEANFHAYRQLLDAGYGKEKSAACMETVQDFLAAGWKELYGKLHST